MDVHMNFLDGQWRPSLGGLTREILNPANGEVIGIVADSNADDTRRAIAAAKQAFYSRGDWRRMSGPKRAEMLLAIADGIKARAEELATLDTLDNGKPLREARADVDDAAACFRYYAGLIGKPQGGVYEVPDGFGPMHAFAMHEPVGAHHAVELPLAHGLLEASAGACRRQLRGVQAQ
jgi:betaine-aldehyde dehydrogenase